MSEAEYIELSEKLRKEYFLIKTSKFWYMLGGFIAALVATGLITYGTTIAAAKKVILDEATKQKIEEIHEAHTQSVAFMSEIEAIKKKYSTELAELAKYYSLTDEMYVELPSKLTLGEDIVIKNKAIPNLLIDVQWLPRREPQSGTLLQVHQKTQNNARSHTWTIEKK